MGFTISVSLDCGFDAAVERVSTALKREGFGILTDIDVKATMKAKLGIENFQNYRILGACNPPIAHAALAAEPDIGVMLPCNVIVRETAPGKVEIAAMDPVAAMSAISNPRLTELAGEVGEKLRRAISAI